MSYLIAFHAGWLALALLIGFAMGWIGVAYRDPAESTRWVKWSAAFLAAAVVVALFKLVPGRFGYWLDLGVLMTGAYVIGCVIGAWLRLRASLSAAKPNEGA